MPKHRNTTRTTRNAPATTDAPATLATDAPAPVPPAILTDAPADVPAPATDAQADAPAPDAPAPADVIASARARRLAQAQAHIAAGAHRPNVRTTTDVRIPTGLARYDFSHLAKLPYAKRVAGLPSGSQTFYLTNRHMRDVPAAQLDNAKLARCVTAGLAILTGDATTDGTHVTGALRVTFRTADDIAAELAAADATGGKA